MKKKAVILLILMLVITSLTACGNSDTSSDTNDNSAETEEAAEEEASEETKEETKEETSEVQGKSDEEALADTVFENQGKMFREELTISISESLKADEETMALFEMIGVNPDDYATAMAGHCDLTTGDITVDGDKGSVELLMTMPDFTKMDAYQDEKLEEFSADLDAAEMTEEEAYKAFGEIFMKIAEDPEMPVSTESFTATFTKKDGVWTMDDESGYLESIMNAFGE